MPDEPSAQPPVAAPPPPKKDRFLVRWLKRITVTAVIVVLLSVALLAYAEHRTSKPEFCGSCHIMDQYYKSWQADAHGTANLGVACVDCHYAPGEQNTMQAKLRGLSQVTSYFSGRYGSSRPRAHVDNRSCLTSKCHGDMEFMDKQIAVGTVKFTHANHLRQHEQKQEIAKRELNEATDSLQKLLGKDRFDNWKPLSLKFAYTYHAK